jgi:hypothetical protein
MVKGTSSLVPIWASVTRLFSRCGWLKIEGTSEFSRFLGRKKLLSAAEAAQLETPGGTAEAVPLPASALAYRELIARLNPRMRSQAA